MKTDFTKVILVLLTCTFSLSTLWAQSPEKMSYQAVIRNSENDLVRNTVIGMQISILQGSATGTPVYFETQTPTTNANGLVNIEIGGGIGFNTIDWANGPYFIKTETDPNGGTNYTITGTSQLLSVPYALHAKTAETLIGTITETDPFFSSWNKSTGIAINESQVTDLKSYLETETDPVFNASIAKGITASDTANWNSKLNVEIDGSVTNEIQVLSISNDTIYLSNGGFARLPDAVTNVKIINDSLYITSLQGSISNEGYIGRGVPGSSLAIVATDSTNIITYTSVKVYANVSAHGGEFVMSRGICLSTSVIPTLNNTCYANGAGTGDFTTDIIGLLPNTTYYLRSFATNAIGTSYGNEISFTTLPQTIPTLTTNDVYNISFTSALSGGNISNDGGLPLLERGICWSLSSNPTIEDNKDPEGNTTGSYNAIMISLIPNTTYFVRAYATNALGTAYGNELSFSTKLLSLASITTNAVSNIVQTSATSGGNVTSDNGSSVTSRGICWATSTAPTTSNSKYTETAGLGAFSATMSGLTPATTYYVRSFAVNGAGTVYGNEYSFTTPALTAPVIATKTVTGISSNVAGSGGTISNDGGSSITAKGVCWSLNPAPTMADSKTSDGTGIASYNSTMSGLNPLTTYYVRAYATNSAGTSYGNELSFTTTDLAFPGPMVPTVGTASTAINGVSTASSGGYISDEGGSLVTARGVCWGTTSNPTHADNFSVDGTGPGYFTSTVTGLSGCSVTYYVRAYATNSTGTGFGNQITVSTGLFSTLTTDSVTNFGVVNGLITATSGGTANASGGCAITQRGVCWNTTANPNISNPRTIDGSGDGSFVSTITGLYGNKTYYIRTYSTSSAGTFYGPERTFTAVAPATPYIGQSYAGGIVFYVDGTGMHGLVCSPSDIGTNIPWGCSGTNFVTSEAFGTGASNTATIVAGCGETTYAAKVCDDLVLNGYSDWYLPSRAEVVLLYSNLFNRGITSFTDWWTYMSSSQSSSTNFWGIRAPDGAQLSTSRSTSGIRFKAVRTF